MKPSEKIYEIYTRICKEHKCSPGSEKASDYEYHNAAIVEYLDEQAEKEVKCDCLICKY